MHGRSRQPPTVDPVQNIDDIETGIFGDDYVYSFSRLRSTGDAESDEEIALGTVGIIWANGYATTDGSLPSFNKHCTQAGRCKGTGLVEICRAPPTTSSTITLTTSTVTSSTVTTSTVTTATTSTSTTTTTTFEEQPGRPPIDPPAVTADGYFNLTKHGLTHQHEQGLRAQFFDWGHHHDVFFGKEMDSWGCTHRSAYRSDQPDYTTTVPDLNFPGNTNHGMGSKARLSQKFCSMYEGWIEVP